jgi:hypothetical protein
MSIQVVSDGADGYRLLSADNALLGWVRGRAVGVGGLANEAAIAPAAIRSYVTLAGWLERHHLHPLLALTDDPARFVHDGAHRWLMVGRIHVARLRRGTPYDASNESPSFEILLKGSISEGMAIHAALVALHAAHGSVEAADIAWAGRSKPIGSSSRLAPITHLELRTIN